jgi:pyridoxamine 5'-phosphate oxidase
MSPPEISDLFARLSASLEIKDHPWRWPVLSTVSPDGQPHARIVVLRAFQEETALIYTDARTQKVIDLRGNPSGSLLFFDPETRLQIRAGATATIHLQDDVCETHWAALNDRQRTEYQAIAAPADPHSPEGDANDPALGKTHFAVLALAINRLDVLQLTRTSHIRQKFSKDASQWTGGRVIA